MPRGDGTGPAGVGPMTGRAAGYCAGYSVPGFANQFYGRGGTGRGFRFIGCGRGRGFRNVGRAMGLPGWAGYNPAPYYPDNTYPQPAVTPSQEADALKNQAKYMQEGLNALNNRILELEKLALENEKS